MAQKTPPPSAAGSTQFQPASAVPTAPTSAAPVEVHQDPPAPTLFEDAEPPPNYGSNAAEVAPVVFDPRPRTVDPEVRPGYAPQHAPANRVVDPEVTGVMHQRRAAAIASALPPPWVRIRVFVLRDEPHVRINDRTFQFTKGTDADIEWPLVDHLSRVGIVGSTDPVMRAREEYAKIRAGAHVINVQNGHA